MIRELGRIGRQGIKKVYKAFWNHAILNYRGDMAIFVMYHNISETQRNNSIHPADFEEGLQSLLQAGFQNCSLEELLRTNFSCRGKYFVITFDDGEKGVVEYGLPILRKHRLTACVFIPPALMGKSLGFSWRKWPKSIISLGEIDRYQGYRIEYMNVDDVKRWLDAGCEVGSHGLRHLDLAAASVDPELLDQEVAESKHVLEDLFGIRVNSFCYPFGSFNQLVKERVKSYYGCALTVVRGGVTTTTSIDPYELPRITGGNSFKFTFELSGIVRSPKKQMCGGRSGHYEG